LRSEQVYELTIPTQSRFTRGRLRYD